jgi:WD40 repeat protein
VNSIGFNPNGKFLVSGSDDKSIRLWDIETGDLLLKFGDEVEAIL